MNKLILVCAILIGLKAAAGLQAQDLESEVMPEPPGHPASLGLIFNTANILLEPESFRGGLGLEMGFERYTVRGWVDLFAYTEFNPFSVTLGAAVKKSFLPGRVAPYLGAFLESGFSQIRSGIDADNWTRVDTLPLTVGGLLGVEVFLLDFVSLFVEYDLAFQLYYTNTTVSIAGSQTATGSWEYTLDLGMGNNSRIGFVIYLKAPERPGLALLGEKEDGE